MSRIVCPCSATIERLNDGKDDVFYGECVECQKNKGSYCLSSHWQEPKIETPNIHSDQLSRLNEHFKGAKNEKRKK